MFDTFQFTQPTNAQNSLTGADKIKRGICPASHSGVDVMYKQQLVPVEELPANCSGCGHPVLYADRVGFVQPYNEEGELLSDQFVVKGQRQR